MTKYRRLIALLALPVTGSPLMLSDLSISGGFLQTITLAGNPLDVDATCDSGVNAQDLVLLKGDSVLRAIDVLTVGTKIGNTNR